MSRFHQRKRKYYWEEARLYNMIVEDDTHKRYDRGRNIYEICMELFGKISLKKKLATYNIISKTRKPLREKHGIEYYSCPGRKFKIVKSEKDYDFTSTGAGKRGIANIETAHRLLRKGIKEHPQLAEKIQNRELIRTYGRELLEEGIFKKHETNHKHSNKHDKTRS